MEFREWVGLKNESKIVHEEPFYADLWSQFKSGNQQAFALLAQSHYRMLYNYASRFSPESEFIRDCIQELLLDLWNRRAFLDETAFVKAYLLKALRHKIIKESLRLKRFRSPEDLPFESAESVDSVEFRIMEDEAQAEQIKRLNQLVSRLTRRQQEVIYLRFYQNLDNEEISQIMGVGRQSVANLVYRTIKEIKDNWAASILLLFLFFTFPAA